MTEEFIPKANSIPVRQTELIPFYAAPLDKLAGFRQNG